MREFFVGKRKVGGYNPAFIVAEVSANHKQDFGKAVEIIKAASEAGADAVKLQTYKPDTITLDSREKWFLVGGKDNPEEWKGKSFYELYEEAYTPWEEWHPKLQKLAHELGLEFFSTPFDDTAVDYLETLDVPCYKISAYEATDILLLKKVASTERPVILSVGFATLEEIELSVSTLREHGAKDIALLHCTTSYQGTAKEQQTHLRTMLDLRDRFDVVVGFSDNMGGTQVPVLAAATGASIIEKHIVANHEDKALDDAFSLDKGEFKKMVEKIRQNEKIMGDVVYGPQTEQEEYNKSFRRSLFVAKNIKKGEEFTKENIRDVRPAYGLETKYYDDVLGKKAAQDIKAGTPLDWGMVG